MSLTYVGRSDLEGTDHVDSVILSWECGAYDNGDPLTGSFVPDGAGFQEGDWLVNFIFTVGSASVTFSPATGWTVHGDAVNEAADVSWGLSAPVWFFCYYEVQAGDVGETALDFTVDATGLGLASTNWIGWGEGVAVRSDSDVDTANIHVPTGADAGDDVDRNASNEASPILNDLDANLFTTRTGPGVELAAQGWGGTAATTYDSFAWTGGLIETSEMNVGTTEIWSVAYQFLDNAEDATDATVTWTWSSGGTRRPVAARAWLPFEGTTPEHIPTDGFRVAQRVAVVHDLPYDLHNVRLGGV